MNKKASFEISRRFVVRGIIGVILIFVISSFFVDLIPFISNQNVPGKIMLFMCVLTVGFTVIWILERIAVPEY